MKTTVTVTISFDAGLCRAKAEEILGLVECKQEEVSAVEGIFLFDLATNQSNPALFIDVTFNQGDERIAKLREQLALHGIKADVETTTSVEYTEEDFQSARLLKMTPGSDYLQSVTSELGTKYDLSEACANCGTGAKQVWYERVKRKELPLLRKHRAIMTRNYHILVDASIRQLLVDAGCTGISFAEVHVREELGDWNPIDREQILIEHTLPPMRGAPTDLDEKHRCKVCRRGGRFFDSDKPYRVEDLLGVCDFNLTWEWFGFFAYDGHARRADFAVPRVLVTPKVRNLFRDAGVTTFQWTPIDIEG